MAKADEEKMPELDPLGSVKFLPIIFLGLALPRAIAGAIAVAIWRKWDTQQYEQNIANLVKGEHGYLYAAAAFLRPSLVSFGASEENSLAFVLCLLLAGVIFPLPALALTACFSVGRVVHQIGYATAGYGGHALGFLIAMLSDMTLQMLCVLVAIKSLGYSGYLFSPAFAIAWTLLVAVDGPASFREDCRKREAAIEVHFVIAPDDEEDDEEELDVEYPDSPDGDDPGEESDARRQWHGRGRKARSNKSDSSDDDDMQWGVRLWDDMDSSLPEVLPPELLGWLMLRRSSLSAQQRLNILASVGSSLKADDIERGLRGAEEELRLHERDPDGRGKGKGGAHRPKPRANFWVEQDGEWGLLIEDTEAQEWLEEGTVHWVGHDLSAIYASMDEAPTRAPEVPSRSDGNGFWHQDEDGGYTFWSKAADGEFYTQDQAGTFWAWSDFEDDLVWWSATPEQQKEISEAYAAYEGKVKELGNSAAYSPDMRNKNVGLDAAENSLMKQVTISYLTCECERLWQIDLLLVSIVRQCEELMPWLLAFLPMTFRDARRTRNCCEENHDGPVCKGRSIRQSCGHQSCLMRIPLEWHRIKEEAYAHPCLVAACLTGWPALQCLSFCCSFLFGEVLSSWAFRCAVHLMGLRGATVQRPPVAVAAGEEAQLAGNTWHLGLLGFAASVPPAAVISAICVLHLGGELPRRRAQLALYLQLAATLWSLSFAMLLLRLCSHWQNVTCQEVEKADDLICQDPVQRLRVISQQLRFQECEIVFIILCCYCFNAVLSLLGSLLGLWGVLRLQRKLEGKQALWALEYYQSQGWSEVSRFIVLYGMWQSLGEQAIKVDGYMAAVVAGREQQLLDS
eukprot:g6155.t1